MSQPPNLVQTDNDSAPGDPRQIPQPTPWWELVRCGLVAAAIVAALKWCREDFEAFSKALADLLFSHLLWWLGVAILLLALGSRWIPQKFKAARDWAGKDWIPLSALSLIVFLTFVFDRGKSPVPFYLVSGVVIWFLLVYLLKWQPEASETKPVVDSLNRSYFADRIAELFRKGKTAPHRIAILGPWGSGKSVLLDLIRQRLAKEGNFRIVMVNPWKAKTPDEAWGILASGFDEALSLPSPIPASWARHPLCSLLAPLLPGVAQEVIKFLASEPSRSRDSLLKKVNDAVRRENAKLLILVDDMERSDAAILRSLLQVIDQLDEFEGCHFIFAIDGDKVAEAFNEKGRGQFNTRGFMDKVFDLQIPLPEPRQKDSAEMIRAKAEDGQTPKLAAAFPKLLPLIPANPRAAVRFYEDAKTKEVLFLNRYGATERNWDAFFTILLVENEFPGFLGEITRSGIYRKFSAGSFGLGILLPEKDRRATVPEIVKDLARPLHFARDAERRQRFEQFIDTLIDRVDAEDLHWAAQGYDKLLELAVDERRKLEEEWINHAGKKSIEAMLDDCLPELKRASLRHADPARCAEQLLEMEFDAIKSETNRILYPRRSREADLAGLLKRVKRMRSHFDFAISQSLASDLDFFDETLFANWLELIAVTPTSRAEFDSLLWLQFVSERSAFHVEMTENFTTFQCFVWATGQMIRVLNNLDRLTDLDELNSHCERLKVAMYKRVTSEFSDCFRRGETKSQFPEGFPGDAWGLERYYDPALWLWTGDNGWKTTLRELAAEAPANITLAESCARILISLFLYPLTKDSLLTSQDSEWKRISNLSQKHSEYLRFFWDGAMALPENHESKEMFLRYREGALEEHADKPEVITLIESSFPLPLSDSPT